MPPYKPKPRLNVQSDYLVYLWKVPKLPMFSGRELKTKIDKNFGLVRFIETFEAWHFRPIGHVVVEFGSYAAVELFLEMMAAERVPFLQPPIECQGLLSFGRQQFFELIYRQTDVDLLACDGHPPSVDWNKQRARGSAVHNALAYKPYNYTAPLRMRSQSPRMDNTGPFPRASSTGGGISRFLWHTKSGHSHILTFDNGSASEVAAGSDDGDEIIPIGGKLASTHNNKQSLHKEAELEEGEVVDTDEESNRSKHHSHGSTSNVGRCRSRSLTPEDASDGAPLQRPSRSRTRRVPLPSIIRRNNVIKVTSQIPPIGSFNARRFPSYHGHTNRRRSRSPRSRNNGMAKSPLRRRWRSRSLTPVEFCTPPSQYMRKNRSISRVRAPIDNVLTTDGVRSRPRSPDGSFGSRLSPPQQHRPRAQTATAALQSRLRSLFGPPPLTTPPPPPPLSGANMEPLQRRRNTTDDADNAQPLRGRRRHSYAHTGVQAQTVKRPWVARQQQKDKGPGRKRHAAEPPVITLDSDTEDDADGSGSSQSAAKPSYSNTTVAASLSHMMNVALPRFESDEKEDEMLEVDRTAEVGKQQQQSVVVQEEVEDYWDDFELIEHGMETSTENPRRESAADDTHEEDEEETAVSDEARRKAAEEREITRLLDCGNDEGAEPVATELMDESILDEAREGEAEARKGDAEAQNEPTAAAIPFVDDGVITLSDDEECAGVVKSVSLMSLAGGTSSSDEDGIKEEDIFGDDGYGDDDLHERQVLVISNLPPNYSLDAIRAALQQQPGVEVPCAVRLSRTRARFHCECGARRAARILAHELDAQRRMLLLGATPRFTFGG